MYIKYVFIKCTQMSFWVNAMIPFGKSPFTNEMLTKITAKLNFCYMNVILLKYICTVHMWFRAIILYTCRFFFLLLLLFHFEKTFCHKMKKREFLIAKTRGFTSWNIADCPKIFSIFKQIKHPPSFLECFSLST
jgi:hypothetical protein